ncbi:MAG: radical SAM protein [Rhodospirillales bacterium]
MPVPDQIVVKQLDLELNGGCNYKCQMCPQAEGREKGFLKKMPLPVFEKVIEDALQYGVEAVSLHGSGEPTLNNDMPDMVRYIKDRGLKCISFTNGYKLSEVLARRLIESGLDVLRVSAIGYDRNTYKTWMSKDSFDQVRDNVKRFVDLNRELGGHTELHLYHLIIDAENVDEEIGLYRKNWVDYTGGLAEVWLMHNWSGGYDSPYDRKKLTHTPEKRSCGRPFSPLLQVRAGGLDGHNAAVVACCMTLGKDDQAVLGHLDTQSIRDVVEGEAYENLRRAHIEKRFDDISYCKDCDQLYDLPEALVWTNIPGRQYGESKVAQGVDHRTFAKA